MHYCSMYFVTQLSQPDYSWYQRIVHYLMIIINLYQAKVEEMKVQRKTLEENLRSQVHYYLHEISGFTFTYQ